MNDVSSDTPGQTPTPWDAARDGTETSSPIAAPVDAGDGGGGDTLDGTFIGRRSRVFWLALKTGVFTLFTLGFYRFWMKTRLRRWYWSSVRIGDTPAEYVGDPLEKLLGFLIAVVFLAFYIGIVNLVLMFASFSLFQGNFAAYLLSFVGVVPLWFYASYRARRYVLARTRWRGIRFGLEPGAWGYAWRALAHWGITFLTLGLLWPRMTFWLEKYKADRTFYGDQRIEQGGNWKMLFRPMLHIVLASLSMAGAGFAISGGQAQLAFAIPLLLIWFGYGFAAYKTRSFERLTNTKRAGDVTFESRPSVWRVFWIYTIGYGLAGLVSLVFLVPIGVLALVLTGMAADLNLDTTVLMGMENWQLTALSVLSYFALFLMWSAMTHTFVTMPLWRHFTQTLTVHDPGALDRISQRPRDEFGEAEGFAEALDVGAAI